MTKLRDQLYLGSEADTRQTNMMMSAGITAILNVADDVPNTTNVCKSQIALHVPLKDNTKENPLWLIEHALTSLKLLLDEGKRVLVHCRCGINRSPTICALYLSRMEGRTFDECWAEILNLRPEVYPASRTLPDGFK